MIAMILAMPAIMWGVPIALTGFDWSSDNVMFFVMPLALAWFLVGAIGIFLIACPNCGRSVFIRRLGFGVPWPARTCSKCGRDLTTI